ncbi:MAG: hypothetical protein J6X87_03400 [Clostridia bacterium]|nr:hypothetical protein [Clostridia bacterium]
MTGRDFEEGLFKIENSFEEQDGIKTERAKRKAGRTALGIAAGLFVAAVFVCLALVLGTEIKERFWANRRENGKGNGGSIDGGKAGDEDKEIVLSKYSLKKQDGNWYFEPEGDLAESGAPGLSSSVAGISFDSIEDLLWTLVNGAFQDQHLQKIAREFPGDENGVMIFDIENPPMPFMPEDFSVARLTWYGSYYALSLTDRDGNGAGLVWLPDEFFEQRFKREYTDVFDNERVTFSEPVEKDGKTEYLLTTSESVTKMVRYEPRPGVFVEERYMVDTKGNALLNDMVSPQGLPYQVHVFTTVGDVKYRLSFKPNRAFSEEELLAFGFEKQAYDLSQLVENEDENDAPETVVSMRVRSKNVATYDVITFSECWDESGKCFVSAEMPPVRLERVKFIRSASTFAPGKDVMRLNLVNLMTGYVFEIADGVEITGVTLYENVDGGWVPLENDTYTDVEAIKNGAALADCFGYNGDVKNGIPAGKYIVEISVKTDGKYVPEAGRNERSGRSCLFGIEVEYISTQPPGETAATPTAYPGTTPEGGSAVTNPSPVPQPTPSPTASPVPTP